MCVANNFCFLENSNITLSKHIAYDGVHLNFDGTKVLANNILNCLNWQIQSYETTPNLINLALNCEIGVGSNAGNNDVYCGSELLDQSDNSFIQMADSFDLTVNGPYISDFASPILSNQIPLISANVKTPCKLDIGSITPGIVDISTPNSSLNPGSYQ